jgi:phosphoenolpyruvate-protein kinase (PTS system EI component)
LGLRAIRLSLAAPAIFRTQIRAILRAAVHDDGYARLKILLPFVSNLDEVRRARRIITEVERELTIEGVHACRGRSGWGHDRGPGGGADC